MITLSFVFSPMMHCSWPTSFYLTELISCTVLLSRNADVHDTGCVVSDCVYAERCFYLFEDECQYLCWPVRSSQYYFFFYSNTTTTLNTTNNNDIGIQLAAVLKK